MKKIERPKTTNHRDSNDKQMPYFIYLLDKNKISQIQQITKLIIYWCIKMQKSIYDAIIIGAGHNGLVAANYLSKANKKVLVLQQRHLVGGAALTQQLIDGFKFSRCSYVLSLFRKNIIQELQLFKKGLKIHYRDISSLTPTRKVDEYLLFHKDHKKTVAEIAKFSLKDAQNWHKYQQLLSLYCGFWDKQIDHIPLNYLKSPDLSDKLNFLSRMFEPQLNYFNFGKFITSSVDQFLNSWFQSDILKATLATDGIIGENLCISNHNTSYVLLHHVMGELEDNRKGEWGYVQGGNGKLSQILADSAKGFGAQIRLNSKVAEIQYDTNKKPVAVKLENGQTIEGKAILSNCTNRVTFFDMVKNAQDVLTSQQYHKLKNIQYNGAATKINLALKKLPKFRSFRNHQLPAQKLLQGTIHINCQSPQQLKTAYKQTLKHRISLNPFLDITIPSIFDKTLAPKGYHIVNCLMQYTPYHPNNGDPATPISHDDIKRTFFNQINQYLDEPLENSVHFMDILTPFDLERILNLTEGNIFHGSIGIQNLFVNRVSGNVGGIWLCGSSAHPGGGVMGAIGKQVADRLLKEKVI